MIKIKLIVLFLLCYCFGYFATSQTKSIKGKVLANDDVEGIHILNKTALKFTITDTDGSFEIPSRVLDTLIVSGLKYEVQEVVIKQQIFNSGLLQINLKEKINLLDEIVVGEILTGSLASDIENADVKTDINFYDLGIPGFTGTLPTQNEQRLADADGGNFIYYYGVGLAINVHKILNRVNGNTKEYKQRVTIEFNEKCIRRLKNDYSATIFQAISLPKKNKEEFFQFCVDDKDFNAICKDDNKINDVDFLLKKLKIYKTNLNSRNDKN